NVVFDYANGAWHATYRLDTVANPQGYDLSEIDSITGHHDTRTDQTVDIQVQYVGDPNFYSLSNGKNFSYRPGLGNGATQMAIVNGTGSGPIARGVQGIKFVAADPGAVYRELVATGVPSAPAAKTPPT